MPRESIKQALLISQTAIISLLVLFYHFDKLTLTPLHLTSATILLLLGAIYRPKWAFWFFVGLLPLEALSLAENILPISLKPYQLLGLVLVLATAINLSIGRGRIQIPKPTLFDLGVGLLFIGSIVGAIFSENPGAATRMTVILGSFIIFYLLVRTYISKLKHIKMPLIFFLITTGIIVLYSILQNILFLFGMHSNTVMAGRPNATFQEADWWGMFLALANMILWAVYIYTTRKRSSLVDIISRKTATQLVLITLIMTAIILTVARSAWLGVFASTTILLIVVFITRKHRFVFLFTSLVVATTAATLLVTVSGLTSFDLTNRAKSTGTGLQEITIACDPQHPCAQSNCEIPKAISDMSQLTEIGCTHIDLEEITAQEDSGMVITTTDRPDPNVSIRKDIFKLSWGEIKNQPLTGIGWGSVGEKLGTDASGTSLNSSNIFFQVWLGSGILGLLGFLVMIYSVCYKGLRLVKEQNKTLHICYAIFLLGGGAAVLIPNIFNAGLFLAYIWLYFALTQIELRNQT